MYDSGISRTMRVANVSTATYVPEGYVVSIDFTTHLKTRGIVGSNGIVLTSEEVGELLKELTKVAKQLGIKKG